MVDYLPPAATNDVYALLRVLTEPEKHKQALDDLKTHADESAKALAGAQEAQRKADESLKANRAALTELTAAREAHAKDVAAVEVRKRQLDDHDRNLAQRQKDIVDYERTANEQIDGRTRDLDAREAAVRASEGTIGEREAKLAADRAAHDAAHADLTQRLAKFREFANV